jgi:hypothetical protein
METPRVVTNVKLKSSDNKEGKAKAREREWGKLWGGHPSHFSSLSFSCLRPLVSPTLPPNSTCKGEKIEILAKGSYHMSMLHKPEWYSNKKRHLIDIRIFAHTWLLFRICKICPFKSTFC